MAKKKKQSPVLSFEERLQRSWDKGDWAAFVTIYMRTPREKAQASTLARHFGPALFNCMTTALFSEKNIAAACAAAETILKEELPPALRNCARTTLDYRRLRDEGFAPLAKLEGKGETIPPFGRLRSEMESLVKEQRKPEKPGILPLLEKLSKQYAALPSAKNIARFNTCCRTADELRKATGKLSCAELFRSIHTMMEIIRDLHSSDHPFRGPTDLFFDERVESIPSRLEHPVLDRLWEYLIRSGSARYGADWEMKLRALRATMLAGSTKDLPERVNLQVIMLMRNFTPRELMLSCKGDVAAMFMERPQIWDPLEAFFLDLFDVLSTRSFRSPWGGSPSDVIAAVERIVRNGAKIRPEAPFPPILREHLLSLLPEFPLASVRELLRAGLPASDLPAPTLVRMACAPWWKPAEMERLLERRIPLSLSVLETIRLDSQDIPGNPTMQALKNLEGLLAPNDLVRITEIWFWKVVAQSYKEGVEGKKLAAQSWTGMGADVLQKIRDILPEEIAASRFCALCRGMKRYVLSADPKLTEAFFNAIPEQPKEHHFTLYTWLLTWPDIPLPFLRRLGELTYPFCKEKRGWEKVYRSVAVISSKQRRGTIARDIVELWTVTDRSKKRDSLCDLTMALLWKL